MDNTRYVELLEKEQNKTLKKFEKEELDLLKKLKEVIDKQTAEQVRIDHENLHKAAVEGNPEAIAKVEQEEVDKKEAEIKEEVKEDLAKEADKQEKVKAAEVKKEEKAQKKFEAKK